MPTQNGLTGPNPPTEGAVDCEPEITSTTPTQFELHNKKKPQNFLVGELVRGGELEFWIESLPKDGTGCPGWWMFNQLMEHFRGKVSLVIGYWVKGDNLDEVNQRTAGAAMSLEDAAKQTTTGGYAASWGYVHLEVVQQTAQEPKGTASTPGNYQRRQVALRP